jgi:hypothetical protein
MIGDRSRAEDCQCAGCGYDLRGLAEDSRCPECGLPIAESRGLLQNAHRFIPAIRWLALSYLCLLAPFGFVIKTGLQLVAVYRLRFGAGLEQRVATSMEVQVLWAAALAEAAALILLSALVVLGHDTIVARALGMIMMLIVAVTFAATVHLAVTFARFLKHESILRGLRVLSPLSGLFWLMMVLLLMNADAGHRLIGLMGCVGVPPGLLISLALYDLSRELRREVSCEPPSCLT